jgi:hypothetical protein
MPKYKVEVLAHAETKWVGNGMVFDTPEHARDYAQDLYMRWTGCDHWRVVRVSDKSVICTDEESDIVEEPEDDTE